jgi:hypothetical protein
MSGLASVAVNVEEQVAANGLLDLGVQFLFVGPLPEPVQRWYVELRELFEGDSRYGHILMDGRPKETIHNRPSSRMMANPYPFD